MPYIVTNIVGIGNTHCRIEEDTGECWKKAKIVVWLAFLHPQLHQYTCNKTRILSVKYLYRPYKTGCSECTNTWASCAGNKLSSKDNSILLSLLLLWLWVFLYFDKCDETDENMYTSKYIAEIVLICIVWFESYCMYRLDSCKAWISVIVLWDVCLTLVSVRGDYLVWKHIWKSDIWLRTHLLEIFSICF